MVFPDKLPLTTFAVGIAAAFQAAEAASGFWTACAWCVVILAAAFEGTRGVLSQVELPRWKTQTARVTVTVLALSAVCWLAASAYRREFQTDDLRLTFNVPHPIRIGTDRLDLNYVVLNKGSKPLLIEEIVALEIATTDFSNNPNRVLTVCKSQVLYIPGRAGTESFIHPGQKVLHNSQNRPTLPDAYVLGPPPFPDDEKLDVAIYEPKTLSDDEKSLAARAFSIEVGKASSLTATFDTDEAVWGTHNVMFICGAIKYLTSA